MLALNDLKIQVRVTQYWKQRMQPWAFTRSRCHWTVGRNAVQMELPHHCTPSTAPNPLHPSPAGLRSRDVLHPESNIPVLTVVVKGPAGETGVWCVSAGVRLKAAGAGQQLAVGPDSGCMGKREQGLREWDVWIITSDGMFPLSGTGDVLTSKCEEAEPEHCNFLLWCCYPRGGGNETK